MIDVVPGGAINLAPEPLMESIACGENGQAGESTAVQLRSRSGSEYRVVMADVEESLCCVEENVDGASSVAAESTAQQSR